MGGRKVSKGIRICFLSDNVEDVEGLVELITNFSKSNSQGNLKDGKLRQGVIDDINRKLEKGDQAIIFAHHLNDGRPVGYVLCDRNVAFQGKGKFFILEEYVDPKFRRGRIYTRMLVSAIKTAKKNGKTVVHYEVRDNNHVKLQIAKKHGFETIKTEQRGVVSYHIMKRTTKLYTPAK